MGSSIQKLKTFIHSHLNNVPFYLFFLNAKVFPDCKTVLFKTPKKTNKHLVLIQLSKTHKQSCLITVVRFDTTHEF